jgi:hypothetical protein
LWTATLGLSTKRAQPIKEQALFTYSLPAIP